MGNKDTTATSSQTYGPPDWVKQRYQSLFGQAEQTAQTPYNKKTNSQVADLDPGQAAAIRAIQGSTGVAQPYLDQAAQYAQRGAAPVTGADIASYQNPWTDQVVNATQADFAHQNAQQDEATNSNAAKIGALTGDRSQVAQQIQHESQNRTQNPVIANLRSQGFNTAAGLAETDKGRLGQAAYTFGNLGNEAQQTTLQGQMAALQASGLNQQEAQAQLNATTANAKQQSAYPFQTQQWLAGLESGIGSLSGGTSNGTQTTPGPSVAGQVAGAALTGLSLFSDERLKSDIEEIGKTHDGQPIYRYRMGNSPRTEMGLLAQNVEQTHPDAVGQSQGYKTVNYKTATDDAVRRADGGGVTPYGDSYVPNVQVSHGAGPQPYQQQGGQGGGSGGHSSGGIGDMLKDFQHAHGTFSDLGKKLRTSTDPESGWSTTVNPSGPEGWGNYLSNTVGGWGDSLSSGIGAMGNAGLPTGGFMDMIPSGGFASMLPEIGGLSSFGGGGGFGMGSMGFAEGGEVDDGIADLVQDDSGAYGMAAPPISASPSRMDLGQGVAGMHMPQAPPSHVAAPAPMPVVPAPSTPAAALPARHDEEAQGPLFGLIDEKYRSAMLAAGLGMLASRSPNFGNAVGEGGLAGVQAYAHQQKATIDARKVDLEAQRMAAMATQSQERLRQASEAMKLRSDQAHNQIHAIGSDSNGRPVYGVVDPMTGTAKPLPGNQLADPNAVQVEGEDVLAGKPADYAARVKAIANYKMAPIPGSKNSAIMGDVARYKPDYDAKNYSVAQKSLNEFGQNGQTGKAMYAINTALRHVDAMNNAYEKLGNSGWFPGWVNAAKQGYAKNTGDEDIQRALGEFETEKNGVSVEIDKALKGVGAPDVAGMRDIKDNFHATMAPAQFKGAVTGAVKLLEGRLRGADKAWKDSVIGNDTHPEWLDKDTREIYHRLGGDPEAAGSVPPAPPAKPDAIPDISDPKTVPSGHVFRYKGHTIRALGNNQFEQVP